MHCGEVWVTTFDPSFQVALCGAASAASGVRHLQCSSLTAGPQSPWSVQSVTDDLVHLVHSLQQDFVTHYGKLGRSLHASDWPRQLAMASGAVSTSSLVTAGLEVVKTRRRCGCWRACLWRGVWVSLLCIQRCVMRHPWWVSCVLLPSLGQTLCSMLWVCWVRKSYGRD